MLPGSASVAVGVALTADVSGIVYAASSLADQAWLARIESGTGVVDWSASFASSAVPAPLLLANGAIEDFGTRSTQLLIDRFDPGSGHVTSTRLGDFTNGTGQPAVGGDGSLYLSYSHGTPMGALGVVSRIRPDATIAWTTTLTSGRTPGDTGISTLALTVGGLAIAGVEATAGPATVVALDTTSGAVVWSMALDGTPGLNPAVAPDGSIAVVANHGTNETLYVLESTGAVRVSLEVDGNGRIYAIALDGTILVGGSDLIALSGRLEPMWKAPGTEVAAATIDANGSVIVTFRDRIESLDLVTGTANWTVAAPDAVPCIGNATLTSAAGIVGIGCVDFHKPDGEVFAFGVSDE